jgi:4-hydroxybenzoate polyprenyltransferase
MLQKQLVLRDLKESFLHFAGDIKIAHSIFALPFAASVFVIGQHLDFSNVRLEQLLLLIICMISARSFAMGMNRFLDRHIDAINPRTRIRKIPSGALSAKAGLLWSLAWAGTFVIGAFLLSPLAGWCSVPLLLILMSYSFWKKISWLTHWYLGLCLGLAPVAVEIALTGQASISMVMLGLAVSFWTAGFDILYSLQDLDFDRQNGLRSVPARFGAAKSLWISRFSFIAMIFLLVLIGVQEKLGVIYFAGVCLVASILIAEQFMVRDAKGDGKSAQINAAFFTANAYVSIIFFGMTWLDHVLPWS